MDSTFAFFQLKELKEANNRYENTTYAMKILYTTITHCEKSKNLIYQQKSEKNDFCPIIHRCFIKNILKNTSEAKTLQIFVEKNTLKEEFDVKGTFIHS